MGTELANLQPLAVPGSTPEICACFYEKVDSIITSMLGYLGITIDSPESRRRAFSTLPSRCDAWNNQQAQPSFLPKPRSRSRLRFPLRLERTSKQVEASQETSAVEASVASVMPEAAVLSSSSYALYEALETAVVCIKKEAGRRFSHNAFWENATSKEVSLDVREQLMEKQERRAQEQESEHRAAISRKAALDLREARLLLRENDLQHRRMRFMTMGLRRRRSTSLNPSSKYMRPEAARRRLKS